MSEKQMAVSLIKESGRTFQVIAMPTVGLSPGETNPYAPRSAPLCEEYNLTGKWEGVECWTVGALSNSRAVIARSAI